MQVSSTFNLQCCTIIVGKLSDLFVSSVSYALLFPLSFNIAISLPLGTIRLSLLRILSGAGLWGFGNTIVR